MKKVNPLNLMKLLPLQASTLSNMNIAAKKAMLIEWLTTVQDKSVIKKVESLKNESIKESYEAKMKPMSSRSYKALLEKSEKDYRQGKVTSQKDLEKESKNW